MFDFLKRKKDKIWAFSNENIALVCNEMDLKGKTMLGIGGAGDQAFSFLSCGAENYKAVDTRAKAVEYLKLKKALVKNLDYEEFISAFGGGICCADLLSNIDHETEALWGDKLDSKKGLPQALKNTGYFYNYSFGDFKKRDHFPYLKEKNYILLQSKIDRLEIKKGSLQEELRRGERKYDLVFFSNVLDSAFKNKIYLSDAAAPLKDCKNLLEDRGGMIIATLKKIEIESILKKEDYSIEVLASPRFPSWVYLAFSSRYPYAFILAKKRPPVEIS